MVQSSPPESAGAAPSPRGAAPADPLDGLLDRNLEATLRSASDLKTLVDMLQLLLQRYRVQTLRVENDVAQARAERAQLQRDLEREREATQRVLAQLHQEVERERVNARRRLDEEMVARRAAADEEARHIRLTAEREAAELLAQAQTERTALLAEAQPWRREMERVREQWTKQEGAPPSEVVAAQPVEQPPHPSLAVVDVPPEAVVEPPVDALAAAVDEPPVTMDAPPIAMAEPPVDALAMGEAPADQPPLSTTTSTTAEAITGEAVALPTALNEPLGATLSAAPAPEAEAVSPLVDVSEPPTPAETPSPPAAPAVGRGRRLSGLSLGEAGQMAGRTPAADEERPSGRGLGGSRGSGISGRDGERRPGRSASGGEGRRGGGPSPMPEPPIEPEATAATSATSESLANAEIVFLRVPDTRRAAALQGAIAALPGVVDCRLREFEPGRLVLDVDHSLGATLADRVRGLPDFDLRLTSARDGRLELQVL